MTPSDLTEIFLGGRPMELFRALDQTDFFLGNLEK